MKLITTVESYINSKKEWSESLILLQEIFRSVSLDETIKWGMPTYTLKNKNVVGFSAFKSYVGIWFFQGVFLKDPAKKLINAQEGVTRGQRQWRFQNYSEIKKNLIPFPGINKENTVNILARPNARRPARPVC